MKTISMDYHVHIQRLDSGHFFLWNEGEVERWKADLFAWHQASFYGTSLDYSLVNGRRGIVLDPWMAMDYLAEPQPLSHIDVIWDERTQPYLQTASRLKEIVQHGWYMPDPARWTQERSAWRFAIPNSEQAHFDAVFRDFCEQADVEAHIWLNDALRHLLAFDQAAHTAYKQVVEQFPLLASDSPFHEALEDEWLEQAGFIQDSCPFQPLLQLCEPASDGAATWSLRIVLQDKNNAEHRVLLTTDGSSIGDAPPVDWRPLIQSSLEKAAATWLRIVPELADPAQPGAIRSHADDGFVWYFLTTGSLQLAEAGMKILLPEWWDVTKKSHPVLKARVKSDTRSSTDSLFSLDQLMTFDWKLSVGNAELDEEEFLRLVDSGSNLIKVQEQWVVVDAAYVLKLRERMKRYRKNGLTLREVLEMQLIGDNVTAGGASHNDEQEVVRIEVEVDHRLGDWIARLQQLSSIPPIKPSAQLHTKLRPYQLTGASWMAFLGSYGLGGCLADDMGLGKTVQWIAYLLHRKENGLLTQGAPALLVCPTSVLGNWQKELDKFAPTLRYYVHHGASRKKASDFLPSVQDADLVLTTYPLVHPDSAELQAIPWSAICLDEAQMIKNTHTKQAAAIRKLSSRVRFALTGTPVENRLTELWSIFDFVNPGYLGTMSAFKRQFVTPIERGNQERLAQLRQLIQPFILRRLKKDPAIQLDLPEKHESKMYVAMTAEQGAAYERHIQNLWEKIDTLSIMERRAFILSTMTRLKQICDHPALLQFPDSLDDQLAIRPALSVKAVRLLEMVREVKEDGERCLIFTQFVKMGMLIQQWLQQELQQPVDFLHGGVTKKNRDAMIDRFQASADDSSEASSALVLSLKAGGTGLNLTAANHVFHFDRWWNPAVENQATDRAFRIGQARDVQVHKMITLGTLEERIDEMIERKFGLSQQITSNSENWITELSTEELRDLFTLRKQWLEG